MYAAMVGHVEHATPQRPPAHAADDEDAKHNASRPQRRHAGQVGVVFEAIPEGEVMPRGVVGQLQALGCDRHDARFRLPPVGGAEVALDRDETDRHVLARERTRDCADRPPAVVPARHQGDAAERVVCGEAGELFRVLGGARRGEQGDG
ncbi:MAG: hypothetical protein M5R40_14300 [Anaerolineae bacterium]|nr:hypothetical protein [Anaerolineae bacterium]